jgi:hypothetical protein
LSDFGNDITGIVKVGIVGGLAMGAMNMMNNAMNTSVPQSRKSRKSRQSSYDDIFSMPHMGSGKKSKKKQSYDFELF